MKVIALRISAVLLLLVFETTPATVSAKTDVWSKLGLSRQHITALATDAGTSGIIYAGSSSGRIFKSTDGGQTWAAQDLGPESNTITGIAMDRQNSKTVYAATYFGIFKTTDAGTHWTVVNSEVIGWSSLAIDPRDPGTIYAGTGYGDVDVTRTGVFKSTDAAANWARTSLHQSIFSLAIDPQNTRTLYAGTFQGVAKSTDGGTSWIDYPWDGDFVTRLVIDPMMPNILYAGTAIAAGVFKSTDGGVHWVHSGLSTKKVYAIVIDLMQTRTVYAATESGPFKSVDAAESWSAINEGLTSREITALSSDPAICKVYAGTEDGLFESDIGPVLTFQSGLCVGSAWTLSVSHATPNTPIRLLGISNGMSWEISSWNTTDETGSFTTTGTFAAGTEGNHQLRLEIGGLPSNIVSLVLTRCQE